MKCFLIVSLAYFVSARADPIGLLENLENDFTCNFPPSLWCSSYDIAEQCQVVDQCKKSVWLRNILKPNYGLEADDRVKFTLYHEVLCPDCQMFIANQLWPTYKKIGEIIDLEVVPYGNAREEWDGSQWQFTCQHGPKECEGNLVQTCAIHVANSMNVSFPFIVCMEMSNPVDECARKYGLDLSAVNSCVNGPLGNKLQHEMAVKTDSLNPPHQYVPWVTLNGVHTDDIQKKAETDLLSLICDTYKGTKVPDACKHSTPRGCTRY